MAKIYAVYRHGRLRMETLFAAPMDARYVVYFQRPESDVAIPIQVCDDVPMEQVRAAALSAYRRDHFMGVKSDLERLLTYVLETYPTEAWAYILVGHNVNVVNWFFNSRRIGDALVLNLNPDAQDTGSSVARMGGLQRDIGKGGRRKLLIVDYSYATTGVAAIAQWVRGRFPGCRVKTVAIAEIDRIQAWDQGVIRDPRRTEEHGLPVSRPSVVRRQPLKPSRLLSPHLMMFQDQEVPV